MNAPSLMSRFDRLSLRERILVGAAVMAGVIGLWDLTLMQPLRDTRAALTQELETYQNGDSAFDEADASDPRQMAITRASDLQTQMQAVDAQLTTTAAGFIPARRMIEVVHDVLSRQHGLKLVSLRNLPVASLVPPAEKDTAGSAPFVHPIELVIEGPYTDVLAYVKELEALPWRFRWKTLDLETRQYPVNRVRIELSTLSMDKTWLGV